jgi:hypothetical protein
MKKMIAAIEEGDKRLLALSRRCLWMILVLLIVFSSCDPALQQGYVYNRRVHPAWTQVIPGHSETTCTRIKRSMTCHTTYDPPEIIPHPEEFELDISNCRQNVHASECKTNWVYVSEDVYLAHPIGSYYGGE